MRIELGDHVRSQDGHDVGTIKHLIVDPTTGAVKTLVVEKGMLLPDDVEIPLNAVLESGNGPVTVGYTAEQVHNLARFDEQQYAPAPPEMGGMFPNAPLGGLLWPGTAMGQAFAPSGFPFGAGMGLPVPIVDDEGSREQPLEVQEYLHQQDVENIVMSEGDDVYSRDGEKIGEIHSVTIDTTTGKPTAITVRKGHFFGADTTFLADTIASVDDGIVTLNMDKRTLSPE